MLLFGQSSATLLNWSLKHRMSVRRSTFPHGYAGGEESRVSGPSPPAEHQRLTRRQLLIGAAGMAAAGGGAFGLSRLAEGKRFGPATMPASRSGAAGPVRAFQTTPHLRPPAIDVSGSDPARGYLFLGPSGSVNGDGSQAGPMLVDRRGDPVWFQPVSTGDWAANVRVQSFRGQSVLTWWEGKVVNGYGTGEAVIADRSYGEIARVRPANGRQMDMHEFLLTPQGTALFFCSPQVVQHDLTSVHGPRNGQVIQTTIQEVDVGSGRLVSEWRSLEHVAVTESYLPLAEPYDYMHGNSIALDADGNLLVSARHTWALYKLDRKSGAVIWRMGGRRGNFTVERGAQFSWQHNAIPLGQGLITLFDDGSNGPIKTESQSRGLFLAVDERSHTVKARRSYTHPKHLLSGAMGSVQVLPSGHVVVGWGLEPYATEFAADGNLVSDAELPASINSYRGFRYLWAGRPQAKPAIATRRNTGRGQSTVYTSWNGATHVRFWQVHVGTSARDLRGAGIAKHQGFETAIPLGTASGFVALTALDRHGNPLAQSEPVRI